ncbi:MAG: hypothetical protein NW207_11070 [Cytophagales bacterium]|nr:hypothetical protein [Cytophagales bacterium]
MLIVQLSFTQSLFAQQIPHGFNYQSIARDQLGLPIVNSQVRLRITVIRGNIAGTSVYSEEQTQTTNQFGLISLVIGRGTPLSGTFNTINWANDNYYIQVEVQNGATYVSLGITQFQSVPYALAADNALKIQNTPVSINTPASGQLLGYNATTGAWEPVNPSASSGGTVTTVTAIGPLSILNNGGLDPQITIDQASSTASGYLLFSDWALFNSKLGPSDVLSVGDVIGSYGAGFTVSGLLGQPISTQTPQNGDVFKFVGGVWQPTTASGISSVVGTGPLSAVVALDLATISITQASSTSDGYLSQADWATFNNKLGTATAFSGDVSGTYNTLTISGIQGFPISATPASGQILQFNGTQWIPVNYAAAASQWTTTGVNQITYDGALSVTGSGTFDSGLNVTGNTILQNIRVTNLVGGTNIVVTVDGTGNLGTMLLPASTDNITSTTVGVNASGSNINIATASGTSDGLLMASDFANFSNKLSLASVLGSNISGTPGNLSVTGLLGYPITGISPGQYLVFDGTSFVPVSTLSSGVSSQWTTAGTNIYYTGGNVGINNTNPQAQLHVNSTSTGAASFVTAANGGNSMFANLYSGSSGFTFPGVGFSAASGGFGFGTLASPTNEGSYIGLMLLSNTGNLGIGTGLAPITERLVVVGNASVAGFGSFATLVGRNLAGAPAGSILTVDGLGQIGYGPAPANTNQWVSTTQGAFTGIVTNTPNVAINTTLTAAALKVAGDLSAKGMVVASQTLLPTGVSSNTFRRIYRQRIYIPLGTKTLHGEVIAYRFAAAGTAQVRFSINGTPITPINITTDDPNAGAAFLNVPSFDVSAFAGTYVTLDIEGQADATAEGVLVQGYTLTIND